MTTVDIVGLLVPVTYFVFLATEQLWPAREFPPRRGRQWADLSVWDILFGTFRNPRRFIGECGFESGARPPNGRDGRVRRRQRTALRSRKPRREADARHLGSLCRNRNIAARLAPCDRRHDRAEAASCANLRFAG